jgi:Na+/H+ antiporter NhaD/arsenite permease-like protein
MSDATISLIVLAAIVILFVWNRLPVEVVAIGAALTLYFTGVLDLSQALAGFGDPAVILIACLFVVSEGLDSTGVTAWVGQKLVDKSGESTRRLLLLTMLFSALLTAIIGLNGSVAALLPMAVIVAIRRGLPPSQLLMPLAFAGSAGGMLLLTGSPVNVVISEAAGEAGVGTFSFAEFALAGIPLVAGTILVVMVFGQRLLPNRSGGAQAPDLSEHAAALVQHYSLDDVFHLRVLAASTLVGSARDNWDNLNNYPGLNVITVLDGGTRQPVFDGPVAEGDRLTVIGRPDTVRAYAADFDLGVETVRQAADVTQFLFYWKLGLPMIVIFFAVSVGLVPLIWHF